MVLLSSDPGLAVLPVKIRTSTLCCLLPIRTHFATRMLGSMNRIGRAWARLSARRAMPTTERPGHDTLCLVTELKLNLRSLTLVGPQRALAILARGRLSPVGAVCFTIPQVCFGVLYKMRPNPALMWDAPSAALRARDGSPLSFVC